MTNSSIRPLLDSDIPQVVALHRNVLGSTFNAQVGSQYLADLYLVVFKDVTNSAGWVAITEDGTVTGFLTATLNLFDLEKKIHAEIGIEAKIRVAWYLLTHPSKVCYLIYRSDFSSYLRRISPSRYPTILTIGINSSTQKQGLGAKFITACDTYFESHNVQRYFVDTEASNKQAYEFYSGRGFNKIGECRGNVIFNKEFT